MNEMVCGLAQLAAGWSIFFLLFSIASGLTHELSDGERKFRREHGERNMLGWQTLGLSILLSVGWVWLSALGLCPRT